MTDGISFITDEKGNEKGIILDLIAFRKHGVKASDVIQALSGLQQLIDNAGIESRKSSNWESAKEKLKNLNS